MNHLVNGSSQVRKNKDGCIFVNILMFAKFLTPGASGVGREKGRVKRGEWIHLFWNEFKEATPFCFLSGLQLPSIEKRNDPSTWAKMTSPSLTCILNGYLLFFSLSYRQLSNRDTTTGGS